jgi:hypothetical protein
MLHGKNPIRGTYVGFSGHLEPRLQSHEATRKQECVVGGLAAQRIRIGIGSANAP